MKKIIVGTRGSILAVKQTELVINFLKKELKDIDFEIKTIITSGDKNLNIDTEKGSLKSMFVKEIEAELYENNIDIAVHSMKDMPLFEKEGLKEFIFPIREDNRDVLLSKNNIKLSELKKNAIVGTSSKRREYGVLNLRNDLKILSIRGNIHTRINKMEEGQYDAIVLAAAGIKRAEIEDKITQYFNYEELVPAPAQGVLAIQYKSDNENLKNIFENIRNIDLEYIVMAEREFSKIFDGGCSTPIGAYANIENEKLILTGAYMSKDKIYKHTVKCEKNRYKEAACIVAEAIRREL